MAQPVTDSLAFLMEARHAIEDLSVLRDREEQLKTDERKLERALEAEKKAVSDAIAQTIKKRMEEITSSYDEAIGKGQDKLKKARVKREKAKTQGIKERVEEETSELHSYNRELRLQIKTLFQENHVPSLCKSDLYYSLFFPRWFGEILRLAAALLACFLVIPYGAYLLIPQRKSWYLVAIYFAAILVFGGFYIFVSNKTKVAHAVVLKQGRLIKDQIHSNNKKIKVITSSIRRDKDEALYNLEKYDDEISRIQQELAETANKKKDALNTFDSVTKTIISDEIAANHRACLDKMKSDYEQAKRQLRDVEAQIKRKSLYITDNYEIYLGKEFLQPIKIAELGDIIKSGRATNLSEAISIYRADREG